MDKKTRFPSANKEGRQKKERRKKDAATDTSPSSLYLTTLRILRFLAEHAPSVEKKELPLNRHLRVELRRQAKEGFHGFQHKDFHFRDQWECVLERGLVLHEDEVVSALRAFPFREAPEEAWFLFWFALAHFVSHDKGTSFLERMQKAGSWDQWVRNDWRKTLSPNTTRHKRRCTQRQMYSWKPVVWVVQQCAALCPSAPRCASFASSKPVSLPLDSSFVEERMKENRTQDRKPKQEKEKEETKNQRAMQVGPPRTRAARTNWQKKEVQLTHLYHLLKEVRGLDFLEQLLAHLPPSLWKEWESIPLHLYVVLHTQTKKESTGSYLNWIHQYARERHLSPLQLPHAELLHLLYRNHSLLYPECVSSPACVPLVFRIFWECYRTGRAAQDASFLCSLTADDDDRNLLLQLLLYQTDTWNQHEGRAWILKHIRMRPSMFPLTRFLVSQNLRFPAYVSLHNWEKCCRKLRQSSRTRRSADPIPPTDRRAEERRDAHRTSSTWLEQAQKHAGRLLDAVGSVWKDPWRCSVVHADHEKEEIVFPSFFQCPEAMQVWNHYVRDVKQKIGVSKLCFPSFLHQSFPVEQMTEKDILDLAVPLFRHLDKWSPTRQAFETHFGHLRHVWEFVQRIRPEQEGTGEGEGEGTGEGEEKKGSTLEDRTHPSIENKIRYISER